MTYFPTVRARRAVALTGALAATLTLAACGSGDSGGGGGEPSGPPQSGGTLRYGLSSAPTCSDPAQSGTNQTIYVTRQIVDSLVDQDPASGALRPWLADTWNYTADAKSFTFHLKDGITFSDGTPLTADSVRKNFDSIVALGGVKAPLGASYLSGYVGSVALDPRTVRIEFSAPNAQFLQAVSTPQLGIQADATIGKSAEERCQGGNIGSGPFTYAEWKQNASATLAKRAGYQWGSGVFASQGRRTWTRSRSPWCPNPGSAPAVSPPDSSTRSVTRCPRTSSRSRAAAAGRSSPRTPASYSGCSPT